MDGEASSAFDVLIIGAGLSGIGMACHLTMDHPSLRVALIERRAAMGGTWDLFRYPGVRSDSDMFTFGYAFRPWHALDVMADGSSIRHYIVDTAREYGGFLWGSVTGPWPRERRGSTLGHRMCLTGTLANRPSIKRSISVDLPTPSGPTTDSTRPRGGAATGRDMGTSSGDRSCSGTACMAHLWRVARTS